MKYLDVINEVNSDPDDLERKNSDFVSPNGNSALFMNSLEDNTPI